MNHPWPLWNLIVRTPRLELRPDDDAGLLELAGEARRGIHPKDQMPFTEPWTDVPDDQLGANVLRFHWKQRAEIAPDSWRVNFLVRAGGHVIGAQQISAENFATLGEVNSGSWLGMRHQGRGYGTEMRAAVLMLAFDHLGATQARSGAFADNTASLAISDRLGYVADGTERLVRRGECVRLNRLLLTREAFAAHRPEWRPEVSGLADCEPLLLNRAGSGGANGNVDGGARC
ncbi:GNAT family N-acetyltransferase [Parasphingorhabdus pacifica]